MHELFARVSVICILDAECMREAWTAMVVDCLL